MAGEVAEPYRVLVIADFPAKIDEKAAARLAGDRRRRRPVRRPDPGRRRPRRGPMPPDFSLDELRPVLRQPRLGRCPPRLARPRFRAPPAGARRARRRPTSPPARSSASGPRRRTRSAWRSPSSSSRRPKPSGGHATADRDRRPARQGRRDQAAAPRRSGHGTSQHVLLAGRTGSGKSTLMHALITNIALNYSPDEIDLYLIDFKKGVEFKVYATHELPHASVVAIESEREFGLSVLQRLDAELRAAGRTVPRRGRPGHQRLPQRRRALPRCPGSCSSWTSSRSSSSRRTSSRRRPRSGSTAWSGRAGRSASTSCSARRA